MNPKTVVITGAAGGIGRAAVKRFATDGYRLVLVDQDEQGLLQLKNELGNPPAVACCAGDLASMDFLQQVTDFTLSVFGVPQILINNAAWRTIETMRTITPDCWDKTLRICLTAPAFLARKLAAEMEAQKVPGVMLFVSSMMSDRPAGNSPAYIAAKAGMEGLVRELAVTYGRSGIRVIGIKPGFIDTELSRNYNRATDQADVTEALSQYILDATPLGQSGSPGQVAEAMAWLCNDAAGFITGTSLTIDGGFTANMNAYPLKKILFPNEY